MNLKLLLIKHSKHYMKTNISTTNFIFDLQYIFPQVNNVSPEDDFNTLKSSVSTTIDDLPFSKNSRTALSEIHEILQVSQLGGKKEYIKHQLKSINDPEVQKEFNLLYKHISSLNCPILELAELFELWRTDKLIDVELLLSPGINNFSEIITSYNANTAIRELSNELSKVSFINTGKGEFLLSMFSKRITKRAKGDLNINGFNVEVKTTDGGSPRFTDQDVNPGITYSGFVNIFKTNWEQYFKGLGIPKTGLSLQWIYTISKYIPANKQDQYYEDIENIFISLFPTENIKQIIKKLRCGNINLAKQLYAQANINYYKHVKSEDDKILYLDLTNYPATSICFESCDDLNNHKLRLHSSSSYPIVFIGVSRDCFPQIEIIKTSRRVPILNQL